VAGILLFGRDALVRFRPSWLDVPMATFVIAPLVSLAANDWTDAPLAYRFAWEHLTAWATVYLAGRLYFSDRLGEGLWELGVAIVAASLLYVPICCFEMLMGPSWYLLGLIYGIPPHFHMVKRLGGYRPEGFLTNGIELATWMALATTVAFWLWLSGFRWHRRVPSWAPTLVLFLTTVACRGVYGYEILILGLVAAALTWLIRTRLVLIAMALLIPAYPAARISGYCDGQNLVQLADRFGKAGSLGYRFSAETRYIQKTEDHGLVFGFGGSESGIYDWWSKSHLWPDGWWIHTLRWGGLVGLTIHLLAFFLWPSAQVLARLPARTIREMPRSMAWVLALLLILHGIDSLQNMAYLTPSILVGASLVGLFAASSSSTRPSSFRRPRSAWRWRRWVELQEAASRLPAWTRVLVLVIVLLALELIGQLPRTPWPAPSLNTAPPGSLPATGDRPQQQRP
jgi:hypothetical protein